MKSVRFLSTCPPYNGGDVAGFDEADAEVYVKAGVAVFAAVLPPGAVVTKATPAVSPPPPPAPAAQPEASPEPEPELAPEQPTREDRRKRR